MWGRTKPGYSPFTRERQLASFAKRVDVRGVDECWEWLASKRRFGYGRFWMSGRVIAAHRASWLLLRGEIPEGNVGLTQV